MTAESDDTTSDLQPATWSVWRQGDDGNPFQVVGRLSEDEARRRVRHYESLGHKQLYWAQQELTPKAPPQ